MDADKLTTKAAEAVSAAVTRAAVDQAPTVEPVHLLLAVLALDDPTVHAMLEGASVAPAELRTRAERLAAGQPSVTGSGVAAPQPSRGFIGVLGVADAEAKRLGDTYIAVPHLFIGLAADRDTGALLPEVGPLRTAYEAIRGDKRVTSREAEALGDALK